MRVSLKDIREAFEFVCAGGGEEHQAFLCKQSGKLYYHSELGDDLDSLPDDIDDGEKFLPIPDKRELDLGKPLALNFARQFLPGDFDEVRHFSAKGAPMRDSRTCWLGGTRSINGTISRRKRRKEPRGCGAISIQ